MKDAISPIAAVLIVAILVIGGCYCFYTGYHSNLEGQRLCSQMIHDGTFRSAKECP